MINLTTMESIALKAMGEKSFAERLVDDCVSLFQDFRLSETEQRGLAKFQQVRAEKSGKIENMLNKWVECGPWW